jgi:hypothetical protein
VGILSGVWEQTIYSEGSVGMGGKRIRAVREVKIGGPGSPDYNTNTFVL